MDRRFDVPADIAYLPDSARIRSFAGEPYPDGRRLKCFPKITDFNAFPDAEIFIEDQEGHAVASSSVIGLVNHNSMFTLHIREPTKARSCTAKVSLTYHDEGLVDQKVIGYSIPHVSTPE
ncbi:MAG: hypothetical protein AMJ88_01175 [Anaerolineae bacterium SM23_ 63]|nr:MAG: hypothetical protein AMJ88_01175 [Anaerolineae bacterium SM23_ 63]